MIRKKSITLVRALTGIDRPAARPTDNAPCYGVKTDFHFLSFRLHIHGSDTDTTKLLSVADNTLYFS